MTAVDELRRAATLMRERARAATPGPWTAENEYRMAAGCRCLSCTEEEPYGKAIHDIDAVGEDISPILKPGDADHIASWHPVVALTVADWLEDEAIHIDDVPYRVDADWIERNYRAPLAVARTYLNGDGQ